MEDNKIKIWIENVLRGRDNNEIIFIKNSNIDIRNQNNYARIKYINADNIARLQYRERYNNSIIEIPKEINHSSNIVENYMRGGFTLIEDKDSIKKLIYAIENKDLSICNEIKYDYYKAENFKQLLTLSPDQLRKFIFDRENLIEKIYNKYNRFDCDELEYSLAAYSHKKILVAKFVQNLYRLANFDFIINEKRIGGILTNILNTSSKTVSRKYIGIIGGIKTVSNVRVYDLNINQIELDTKIKIATNLIKLNLKELDVNKIAKNTNLSINQVEKIYKQFHLK